MRPSSKSAKPKPFVQLDLFADAPPPPKAVVPEAPVVVQAPKPDEPWTASRALLLLDPDTAELLILSLGLRQRRPHRPDEIAMILSRPHSWVTASLRQAYQVLRYHLKDVVVDPKDVELAKIQARLAQVSP